MKHVTKSSPDVSSASVGLPHSRQTAKKPYVRPTSHTSPAEIQSWIDECKAREAAREELASGPWAMELVKSNQEFWAVRDKDGWPVISNEKNTRLMAAAPELLRELETICERAESWHTMHGHEDEPSSVHCDPICERIPHMQAAIRKARRGQ